MSTLRDFWVQKKFPKDAYEKLKVALSLKDEDCSISNLAQNIFKMKEPDALEKFRQKMNQIDEKMGQNVLKTKSVNNFFCRNSEKEFFYLLENVIIFFCT